jgi:O-antigen/teichoic acid export membrane protein
MSKATGITRRGSIQQLVTHFQTPLFRNAYALIFNSAATSMLGIAYWALAARYYPAEVVGENSAAIAATLLLSDVAVLYLDGAFIRFIPRAAQAAGRFILVAYLIATTVAALVSLVFLLGIQIWSPALSFLDATPWSMTWFILATTTGCIFLMQDGALTGLRQAVWVPVENTTFAVAKIALLVFLATRVPEYGIFVSWTIPAALLILPVNWLIFRRLLSKHRQATLAIAHPVIPSQVAQYVAGNYVGFLFLQAYTKLLPLMVIQLAGSRASAYFYLPWVIASSLQLVPQNMSVSLVVEGTLDQDKLRSLARRALFHTLRLLAPVALVLVLGAPLLLRIFGTAYAAEGSDLLRLLALATVPNVFFVLFIGFSRVQRHILHIVVAQAAVAVLTLTLGYILLPRYGITGVGLAWLISQVLAALAIILVALYGTSWRRYPRTELDA